MIGNKEFKEITRTYDGDTKVEDIIAAKKITRMTLSLRLISQLRAKVILLDKENAQLRAKLAEVKDERI